MNMPQPMPGFARHDSSMIGPERLEPTHVSVIHSDSSAIARLARPNRKRSAVQDFRFHLDKALIACEALCATYLDGCLAKGNARRMCNNTTTSFILEVGTDRKGEASRQEPIFAIGCTYRNSRFLLSVKK